MIEVRFLGSAHAFDDGEGVDVETLARAMSRALKRTIDARDVTFLARGRAFRANERANGNLATMAREEKNGILRVMMVIPSTSTSTSKLGKKRTGEWARTSATTTTSERSSDASAAETGVDVDARAKAWRATGFVGLRACSLLEIPEDVFALGARARAVDVAGNRIRRVPRSLGDLIHITRLVLSDNALRERDAIPWCAFASLSELTFLDVSSNAMEALPDAAPAFGALESLSLARNELVSVPDAFFANAPKLRHLSIAYNAIEALPCAPPMSLEYVDARANRIRRVPESYAALIRLQTLTLDGNAIDVDGIPSVVLKSTEALYELSLHGNPVKLESLRNVDGWNEFDARRKARANKALDSRVMLGSSVFDEGADKERYRRH